MGLGVDALKSIVPGTLTMKANTALCFVAMGAALILANRDDGRSRRIAVGLGGSAGVVAAVIGAQYLAGANFGVDELLFREPPGAVGTVHPGRMSPQTAMSFVIIAACLMLAPRPRWRRLVIALATIPAALGAMNVLDFTFGGDAPSFLATYSQMALPTAATFLVLSVGVLGLMGARDPLAVLGEAMGRCLAYPDACSGSRSWFRSASTRSWISHASRPGNCRCPASR
ncbi:MAG: hypothetical protein H0X16_12150 [Chloroflexi bacterium]|nr:hypothetical protein [Chloroflexota bacterium]